MFLVDTNVISEARKGPRANSGVRDFFRAAESAELYIAVQTLGEIRRGVENIRRRGDVQQARLLETWLDSLIQDYGDRILAFDDTCALVWGHLMSPHAANPVDKQIATIALVYRLTVVSRNVADFSTTGVAVVNPFLPSA